MHPERAPAEARRLELAHWRVKPHVPPSESHAAAIRMIDKLESAVTEALKRRASK